MKNDSKDSKENKENKKNKEVYPYDDIINLERHISSHRKHMPIKDRAAQFSPFAALTGFDIAIKEAARLTNERIELDETEKSRLDDKLRIIQEQLSRRQVVEVVFFRPDEQKAGGTYISVSDYVKKIDGYERVVIMQDGTRIQIEEIIDITGGMFQTLVDF